MADYYVSPETATPMGSIDLVATLFLILNIHSQVDGRTLACLYSPGLLHLEPSIVTCKQINCYSI
jgi:hypothetical protein